MLEKSFLRIFPELPIKIRLFDIRSIYFPSMQVGGDEEAQYDSTQRKSNPPSCIVQSSSTVISCKRHRKQILEQTEH